MSNKTPRKQDDATESARSRNPLNLILGLILLFVGGLAIYSGISSITDNKQRLITPDGVLTIEIADTTESRIRGLSGRESIDQDEGLMFVFDQSSEKNCFWMKDMNFSIDMVWLDESKTVITVTENVAPETYPESFCPQSPAKYGLELKANRASELGISPQQKLRF